MHLACMHHLLPTAVDENDWQNNYSFGNIGAPLLVQWCLCHCFHQQCHTYTKRAAFERSCRSSTSMVTMNWSRSLQEFLEYYCKPTADPFGNWRCTRSSKASKLALSFSIKCAELASLARWSNCWSRYSLINLSNTVWAVCSTAAAATTATLPLFCFSVVFFQAVEHCWCSQIGSDFPLRK